jgi:hypothetical protein
MPEAVEWIYAGPVEKEAANSQEKGTRRPAHMCTYKGTILAVIRKQSPEEKVGRGGGWKEGDGERWKRRGGSKIINGQGGKRRVYSKQKQ